MILPAAPAPPAAMASRFFVVGFLPTYTALLFLLVMVWAASGKGTSFKRAWRVAGDLTAAQIVLILLSVLLVEVLLMPFQLGLVRVLEGSWPARLGGWMEHQAPAAAQAGAGGGVDSGGGGRTVTVDGRLTTPPRPRPLATPDQPRHHLARRTKRDLAEALRGGLPGSGMKPS